MVLEMQPRTLSNLPFIVETISPCLNTLQWIVPTFLSCCECLMPRTQLSSSLCLLTTSHLLRERYWPMTSSHRKQNDRLPWLKMYEFSNNFFSSLEIQKETGSKSLVEELFLAWHPSFSFFWLSFFFSLKNIPNTNENPPYSLCFYSTSKDTLSECCIVVDAGGKI